MTMYVVRLPDDSTRHTIIFNGMDDKAARALAAAGLGQIVHATTEELVKELYPCGECLTEGALKHIVDVGARK